MPNLISGCNILKDGNEGIDTLKLFHGTHVLSLLIIFPLGHKKNGSNLLAPVTKPRIYSMSKDGNTGKGANSCYNHFVAIANIDKICLQWHPDALINLKRA